MASTTQEACEISGENYAYLQQQIYRSSGIVLDESKRYLLEARLTPIVRRENLKSMEAMTTNETFFFRDVAPFKILKEKILPALLKERKSSRQLSWFFGARGLQPGHDVARNGPERLETRYL